MGSGWLLSFERGAILTTSLTSLWGWESDLPFLFKSVHLLKHMFNFPLLVVKGIYHY